MDLPPPATSTAAPSFGDRMKSMLHTEQGKKRAMIGAAIACGVFVLLLVVIIAVVASGSGDSHKDNVNVPDKELGHTDTQNPPTLNCGFPSRPPYTIIANNDFEIRKYSSTSFQSKAYDVVYAMPWNFVLERVQGGKKYPMIETEHMFIVDSDFQVPYIRGVTDDVIWVPPLPRDDGKPTSDNGGWGMGQAVKEQLAKFKRPMVFHYHVRPGLDYGYWTDSKDSTGVKVFRPSWMYRIGGKWLPDDWAAYAGPNQTYSVELLPFDIANQNKYGFEWPRPVWAGDPLGKFENNLWGFMVDTKGRTYIPKCTEFGRLAFENTTRAPKCVVINKATAPIPVTRTQFPGDESYYLASTFLPGYAHMSCPGHNYWGQRGQTMLDAARWDSTLPGNFNKPYGGAGCAPDGYDVGHAEGFTWPELRDKQYAAGVRTPCSALYKITVYRQQPGKDVEELGWLSYEQRDGKWYPIGGGQYAHYNDQSRNTYQINGHLWDGHHAWIVLEDIC